MNLFDFSDFRAYLKARLAQEPRGTVSKWAGKMAVHPSLLSLVMQGPRSFTVEQAFDLAEILGLSQLESEYFQKLIALDRAGNPRYRKYLETEIKTLKQKSLNLSERFEHEKSLSETQQAQFYSNRFYSAIRLYCSTSENGKRLNEIEETFHLERAEVQKYIEFLLQAGLVQEKNGAYVMGTQRTFLPRTSPFLPQHHMNWRVGALGRLPRLTDEELMFTAPVSISVEDFAKLREMLSQLISKSSVLIKESPAEQVACMNLDLFWVTEKKL